MVVVVVVHLKGRKEFPCLPRKLAMHREEAATMLEIARDNPDTLLLQRFEVDSLRIATTVMWCGVVWHDVVWCGVV